MKAARQIQESLIEAKLQVTYLSKNTALKNCLFIINLLFLWKSKCHNLHVIRFVSFRLVHMTAVEEFTHPSLFLVWCLQYWFSVQVFWLNVIWLVHGHPNVWTGQAFHFIPVQCLQLVYHLVERRILLEQFSKQELLRKIPSQTFVPVFD